jgi:Zn-finger protein
MERWEGHYELRARAHSIVLTNTREEYWHCFHNHDDGMFCQCGFFSIISPEHITYSSDFDMTIIDLPLCLSDRSSASWAVRS